MLPVTRFRYSGHARCSGRKDRQCIGVPILYTFIVSWIDRSTMAKRIASRSCRLQSLSQNMMLKQVHRPNKGSWPLRKLPKQDHRSNGTRFQPIQNFHPTKSMVNGNNNHKLLPNQTQNKAHGQWQHNPNKVHG